MKLSKIWSYFGAVPAFVFAIAVRISAGKFEVVVASLKVGVWQESWGTEESLWNFSDVTLIT